MTMVHWDVSEEGVEKAAGGKRPVGHGRGVNQESPSGIVPPITLSP
jgi:hypothetical protein